MPTIVHFELPADDVERAKKFYSDLFGWKMEK
jgi:predicted enzyme related to lactoylglutathione lyase